MRGTFVLVLVAVAMPLTARASDAAVTPAATSAPVKCAIPKPCAVLTNTGSGPALEGVGTSGVGLLGTSASGVYYEAGVDGESTNQSGNDAGGVFGGNYFVGGNAPQYGIVAAGAPYGVLGYEALPGTNGAAGYGVLGQDEVGTVNASGDYNVGVGGQSTVGTGVLGESNASPQTSLFGDAPIGVYGVASTAAGTNNDFAFALVGETNSFGLDIHDLASPYTAFFAVAPGSFLSATSSLGSFSVSTSGNEVLSGTLTTSKGTYVRTTGASGSKMIEYADRSAAPELDDTGEASLASGRGHVTIDARLGDTMDRRAPYQVFLTPEGDCNGLYIANKSASGFDVRELRGGRSSLTFDYRIVAKPVDEDGARLATAPVEKRIDDGIVAGRRGLRLPAPPLSPQEKLKRKIGTQAYAEAMLQERARRRLAVP